jgi:RND family efflux transporter MFP subunit
LSYPDKIYKAKVSFINPSLNPETRTVKIRAELNNPEGLLKPGMFVNVTFKIATSEKSLVIPAKALLDTGSRKIVYVSIENGKYVGRNVTVKQKIGDYYPVISGVKENDEVVVNANFLIDSESQLKGTISN